MEIMSKSQNVKKSIILSGLIGTGGLFAAKMLGLFYSIPLSGILGSDAYMSYYGTAYRIYSYILNVFTAGFPFAIATLVARFTVAEDNKTLLAIRRMAVSIMSVTGFLGMLLMMLSAGVLAPLSAPPEDVPVMANVLRFLSAALFFVPMLSAYRGFYQGRKEMQEYAFSQAFEQFFRVGFLLSASYLAVYVLHRERRYALYIAVLSTSIAAVAGVLQIKHFDRHASKEIVEAAKTQQTPALERNELLKQFVALAVPYLLVAVMGYSDDLFNSLLLPSGLRTHGYNPHQTSIVLSAFNYVGTKLTAIPMILAPGFTAALIPHIASALAEKDGERIRSNVLDCLNIIFYIGLPVSFCIFLYAREVYDVLFFTEDPVMSSQVLKWIALEGFLGTLTPVVTNLMMALEMKKDILKRLLVCTVIKGGLMLPFISLFGFAGAVLSSACGYLYLIFRNLGEISHVYEIDFRSLFGKLIRIAVGLAVMFAVYHGLKAIGLNTIGGGRLIRLIKMCLNGMLTVASYLAVTVLSNVPQEVFHKGRKFFTGKK